MNSFVREYHEKLLLAAAIALLAGSAVWTWALPAPPAPVRRFVGKRAGAKSSLPTAAPEPAHGEPARWRAPAAPKDGPGWIYELFTPPDIYYDAAARLFSNAPPTVPVANAGLPPTPECDAELLAVKRQLFRLQLSGFVGSPGDCAGIFVVPQTGETLLARAGRRFPQLGLRLLDLRIEETSVEQRDRWPAHEKAAFADLLDERTGGRVTLDSRTPALTRIPLAVVRLGPDRLELREGEFLRGNRSAYRVTRIQLEPPEVEIVRWGAQGGPADARVLHPKIGRREPVGRRRFQPAEPAVQSPPDLAAAD